MSSPQSGSSQNHSVDCDESFWQCELMVWNAKLSVQRRHFRWRSAEQSRGVWHQIHTWPASSHLFLKFLAIASAGSALFSRPENCVTVAIIKMDCKQYYNYCVVFILCEQTWNWRFLSYANNILRKKSTGDSSEGLQKILLNHCLFTQNHQTTKWWSRWETVWILLKNRVFQPWFKKNLLWAVSTWKCFPVKEGHGGKRNPLKYWAILTHFHSSFYTFANCIS